jgi:nucleoside-diphosphate-sugar epimerase
MKVLFIGGTGVISSACTNLAVQKGIELYHLNRGSSSKTRPVPVEVKQLTADVRNRDEVENVIEGLEFDAVVDWISFVPSHIENNLAFLKGKVKQYVFISSASAYQTPPQSIPVTEDTPLYNPYWQYSRDKIACEEYLTENAPAGGINFTIVRPSHTYDKTMLPFDEGYTAINRMKQGKPVVVLGDGTSIWTLTNHADFAVGLVGLLDNKKALNDVFHITSDEWLTWNQIYTMVGQAFGFEPKLVHVPSDVIASFLPEYGAGLLGDKMHSMIFDNSKIKSVVPGFDCKIPFSECVKTIAEWYKTDIADKFVNQEMDKAFDEMIERYSLKK